MLRVVLGRARPDTDWSGGKISSIQFNTASRSARSRGATGTIMTVPRSYFGEINLEANAELRTDPLTREEGMSGKDESKMRI
jgi:hypothetical protein